MNHITSVLHSSFNDLIERSLEAGARFYAAQEALDTVQSSQDKFRAAVLCGSFEAESVKGVLHELDALAEDHAQRTSALFERYQELAFDLLEIATCSAGLRGSLVQFQVFNGIELRHATPFKYARIDIRKAPREGVWFAVSEKTDAHGLPQGALPSSARIHRLVPEEKVLPGHHVKAEVFA